MGKKDGMEATGHKNAIWMERGLLLADQYLPHGQIMGEDFQRIPGIGAPTSEHAWGVLVQAAIRKELIYKTNEFRRSQRENNNEHEYRVYYRSGYPNPGSFLLDHFPPKPPPFTPPKEPDLFDTMENADDGKSAIPRHDDQSA